MKMLLKLRDLILSLTAMAGVLVATMKFMVTPWILEAIRNESYRTHYIRYADWCELYKTIESRGELTLRQAEAKEEKCAKKDFYLDILKKKHMDAGWELPIE